jgi:hypothetical protein
MDPKMFAKMAKFAALMGPSTAGATKKTKGKASKKAKNAQPPSSGIDPLMMYTMMQQNGGQIDPLMMMLMSSPKSAPTGASGGTFGFFRRSSS